MGFSSANTWFESSVNGSLPVTSWSTAGVHVSNILRKLGAKRRVDAAGIAHKLGLLSMR